MKRSTDRILTTHAGRLSVTRDLMQVRAQKGQAAVEDAVVTQMRDDVRKQADIGLDVISDGEFGKFGGY